MSTANKTGKGSYRGIPVEINGSDITFKFKDTTALNQFLANMRFENQFTCSSCKHTFFAKKKIIRTDNYDTYFAICPNCNKELYVGSNCYWR